MHDHPAGTAAFFRRGGGASRVLARGLAAAMLLAPAACGGASSLGSSAGSVSSLASSLGSGGGSSLGSALPSASSAMQALSGGGAASGLTSAAQPAMSALSGAASSAVSSVTGPAGTHTAQVRVTAASDANANAAGQGAPVMVRIYQLGSASAFDKAEFFRLLNSDAATLGSDLIAKDELLVAPGATKSQSLALTDRVRAIGLFAAFRDFQTKAWRLTLPVPPGAATVPVTVTAAGLTSGT